MMQVLKETKERVKVAILVPSMGTWAKDFGMSLATMCVYIATRLFEQNQERDILVLEKVTSVLPQSRQWLLEDALLNHCTHALFIDSDQVFPQDTLHRLMAWKKPVVACNIARKTNPSFPTAAQRGATMFGVPVTSEAPKEGLEKVWRIGCGVMLIDLSVMKNIPKPWFETRYSQEENQFIGEDWHFIDLVQKAGHDVFVDHGLSREVGHIGAFNFTHANIPSLAEAVAA